MEAKMRPGQTVIATDSMGRSLQRIVTQIIGNTVVICKKEEWEKAEKEGRKPIGVGFPMQFVKATKSISA
jgi:hypothetical protein